MKNIKLIKCWDCGKTVSSFVRPEQGDFCLPCWDVHPWNPKLPKNVVKWGKY